ncbi:hypothetical protein ILUMI_15370 [Ignelater luminosus]|uniref:Uncharacterized protein n=1 Tax=Ignelater luminosus TaxID=2038154 RepID=A0A8K0GA02_IGNLU|nr:hypothetical protein ILUMI_15370 [Ignelater luminosus]
MVSRETQNTENIKSAKCSENLSFYFTEYCDNTSIHGLKFLGERKRSILEKIWWLIFITASIYFCTVLILKTYNKWINAPVLVSFATSETAIWKIPFPAVTICPLTRTEKSKLDIDDVIGRTDVDFKDLEMQQISMVCPRILEKILTEQNYTTEYDTLPDNVNDFLYSVS